MFGTRPTAPSKKDDDYGMPQLKQHGGGGEGGGGNARAMSAPVYQKQTSGLFSSNPYGNGGGGGGRGGSSTDMSAGLAIFGRGEAPSGALVPSCIPIAADHQQQHRHHTGSIVPLGHPPDVAYGRGAVGAPVQQQGQPAIFNSTMPPASTPPPPSVTITAPPAMMGGGGNGRNNNGGGGDDEPAAGKCSPLTTSTHSIFFQSLVLKGKA